MREPLGKIMSVSEDEKGIKVEAKLDVDRVARVFRVPPWLVDYKRPVPRFPRLAWFWIRLRWRFNR